MKKTNEKFLILATLSLILLIGCKKKELVPVINTSTVSNITATSAQSGGIITDEGSSTVTSRGICWSTGTTPTIEDNKTTDGAGAGSFLSNIVDLFGGTTYFVRAYASNSSGISYGMALSFKTSGLPPSAPIVTEQNATSIQTNSVQLNVIVNAMFYSTAVTFEYGTSTNYGSSIIPTQSPVTGNLNTNVSASITGLSAGNTYHYRIKAINSLGTTISDDMTFTTLGKVPTVTTITPTNITIDAAQLNGSVNANYLSSIVTFEYGTTTGYGTEITASQSPVTGGTTVNVNSQISGLTVGTTYHFRIKAVNSLGTTYGNDLILSTLGQAPSVTTLAVTNISLTGAQINGNVNSNNLPTVVTFEYGTTIGYGTEITASQSPVTGGTTVNVNSQISGLTVGTTYHFRIKAVNSLGTTYGNDLIFSTLGQVPSVTTLAVTNVTSASVRLNGIVNANYLSTVVTFEYGTTSSYGTEINPPQSPVTGFTNVNVSSQILGLTVGTTYHFRLKAVNSLGVSYSNDMSFKPAYFIGEIVNGGIIFLIDGTGLHGLVCTTPYDFANNTEGDWGCFSTSIAGADGISIGTGNQNTIDIVNGCSTAGIAARICFDLELNGYTDWYLPSKDELILIYTNLITNGLLNVANPQWNWSSSEFSPTNAWVVNLSDGAIAANYKTNTLFVLPIRSF